MRALQSKLSYWSTAVLLGLTLVPVGMTAQVREVVSNQLAISGDEAALHLEYRDDGTFDVAFSKGEIFVDGEAVGSYTRGDALDTAWRALLGEVVTLDNGDLARALRDWDPPSSLGDEAFDFAVELDRRIEDSLQPTELGIEPLVDVEIDPAIDITIDASRLLDLEDRIRDELRLELTDELRDELRHEFRRTARDSNVGIFSQFATVSRGVAGVFEALITFVILAAMGLGVVFLAKDNLEVVAETARRTPGRAAMVGFAGAFLVLPTWVLGSVALVVSVVGIIALPFWLFLFPLAVALAAGLGYFAVARNIGEWVAAQRLSGLDWLRATNTAYAVMAGVGTLVMFSVAANVVGMVPILGILKGLFVTLGTVATFTAVCVGFGAVLLTRAGRRPEFYDGTDPFEDEAWSEPSDAQAHEEVIEAEEMADDDGAEAAAEDDGGADDEEEPEDA